MKVLVTLTHDDLDAAKEVLRRYFVVGLLVEKAESVRRFKRFFGLDDPGSPSMYLLTQREPACIERLTEGPACVNEGPAR